MKLTVGSTTVAVRCDRLQPGEVNTLELTVTAGREPCRLERLRAVVRPRVWESDGVRLAAGREYTLVSGVSLVRGGTRRVDGTFHLPPQTPGTLAAADAVLELTAETSETRVTRTVGIDAPITAHETQLVRTVPGEQIALRRITRHRADDGYVHAYRFGPVESDETVPVVTSAVRNRPVARVGVDPATVGELARFDPARVADRVRSQLSATE